MTLSIAILIAVAFITSLLLLVGIMFAAGKRDREIELIEPDDLKD